MMLVRGLTHSSRVVFFSSEIVLNFPSMQCITIFLNFLCLLSTYTFLLNWNLGYEHLKTISIYEQYFTLFSRRSHPVTIFLITPRRTVYPRNSIPVPLLAIMHHGVRGTRIHLLSVLCLPDSGSAQEEENYCNFQANFCWMEELPILCKSCHSWVEKYHSPFVPGDALLKVHQLQVIRSVSTSTTPTRRVEICH